MSGVVLRCPNCGTTRATSGLCEACHEAEVRCYCTNHTPGLWLDAPACAQCGARLGEPDLPQPPRQRSERPSSPASTSAPRPRFRPVGRPSADAPPGRRETGPRAGETHGATREERGVPVTSLQEILLAALQARRRSPPTIDATRETLRRTRSPGGCLVRFVLVMVFLFLAMVSSMFVFGGSVLRLFMPF